jgi:amidohydrolase
MTLDSILDEVVPHAVSIRHRIHEQPELAYEEFQTAQTIRQELSRLGISFHTDIPDAPTATVGMIGNPSLPCVALRADIDALPILEQTGLPYASKVPGKMHACGHDGHIASLLATAATLKRMESSLKVCVKLVFQPAEEGGAGAARLVNAGVLDGRIGPRVSAIYGLHGYPGLPVGVVSTRPGPLLASTDTFRVVFKGVGCHGAFPHLGRDPIVAASEAVVSLQQIVSRELDPTEPGLITVGLFHAGTAVNIIPDTATIEGTIRTLTPQSRMQLREALKRKCEKLAEACGCEAQVELREGYPATINHADNAQIVASLAQQQLGAYVPAARPMMGGEDFAYYLERVPGCFFMVGVKPDGQSEYPPLHSDHYDFTDAALPACVRMFVGLVGRHAC